MAKQTPLEAAFSDYDKEVWSEADTRSKFIDYVLLELCQIPESLIRREFHKSKVGYLDYLVLADPFSVVVEAKRSTVRLIDGAIKSGVHKLGTLLSANKKLVEHVTQVAAYGATKGSPIVVLTNGSTWIIFEPYRKGSDLEDLPALVYADLLGKDKVYSPGWLSKLLSIHGIQNSAFAAELGLVRTIPAVPAVVADLDNSTVEHRDIELELLPSIQKYFRDAGTEMSHDLLQKSWINPAAPALRDTNRGVKYQPKSAAELLDTRKGVEGFVRLLDSINETSEETAKVVPLIGEPGTGKTHFIRLTMLQDNDSVVVDDDVDIKNKEPLQVKRLWIYTDLRLLEKVPTEQLEGRLFEEILTLIHKLDGVLLNSNPLQVGAKDTVRSMFPAAFSKFSEPVWKEIQQRQPLEYAKEVDRAFEGCMANRPKYLRALLRHISERHKVGVRLVLDNADQLGAHAQEAIYLFAEAIAYKSKSAIIVALRESWYSFHKSEGATSAFSDFVYALAPVPVVDVIVRRLELVEEDASARGGPKSLGVYFTRSLSKALRDNDEIYDLFEGLSNHSCRRGLNLTAKVTRSAQLNVKDLWWAKENQSEDVFHFQLHQLLAPLICGRHRFYDSSEYPFFNVFAASVGAGVDHWIKIRVLKAMQQVFQTRGNQKSRGYISRTVLVRNITLSTYYSIRHITELLVTMAQDGLIEFEIAPRVEDDSLEGWGKARITTMGQYALLLFGRLSYIFHMMPLTPTNTPHKFREELRKVLRSHEESVPVQLRIQLVEEFVAYLKDDVERHEDPAPVSGLELVVPSAREIYQDLVVKLEADIHLIEKRAQRSTSARLRRVVQEELDHLQDTNGES